MRSDGIRRLEGLIVLQEQALIQHARVERDSQDTGDLEGADTAHWRQRYARDRLTALRADLLHALETYAREVRIESVPLAPDA